MHMAVQAQHPNPSYNFSKDFLVRTRINVAEELQMLQNQQQQLQTLLGANLCINSSNNNNNNNVGAVLSDLQKSELTCNASGSRKRSRGEPSMAMPQPNNNGGSGTDQHCFPLSSQPLCYPNLSLPFASGGAAVPGVVQSRLLESSGTSTSGRPAVAAVPASASSSPLAQDLVSHFYQQSIQIDALVRFQSERLRAGLEAARKRHCRALLSVMEARVMKRLKEKETELEDAHRRNAELEENIRQMTAENHVWFNVAKNNEAIACSLRSSIEQVMQNSAAGDGLGPAVEGYGDSGDAPPSDDAQSCCYVTSCADAGAPAEAESVRRRRACRACGNHDVCVLLLPCRHLCLCRACESKVDACPVCHSARNASLQVYIS